MVADIKHRLERLELAAARVSEHAPVLIYINCAGRDDDAVSGIRAIGDRLPEIIRAPGETVEAMRCRAEAMVKGAGPLIIFARYDTDDEP